MEMTSLPPLLRRQRTATISAPNRDLHEEEEEASSHGLVLKACPFLDLP
jgi:hypothetical protein